MYYSTWRVRPKDCLFFEMDVQKLIGSNIRKHRMAASISQEELAARMNVDQAYVSRLEGGQKNPTVSTMSQVAKSLGVKLNVLFDIEEY